ncbi:MAG TPA: hypothetical protein VF463_13855 [Sphingobium sp.]
MAIAMAGGMSSQIGKWRRPLTFNGIAFFGGLDPHGDDWSAVGNLCCDVDLVTGIWRVGNAFSDRIGARGRSGGKRGTGDDRHSMECCRPCHSPNHGRSRTVRTGIALLVGAAGSALRMDGGAMQRSPCSSLL